MGNWDEAGFFGHLAAALDQFDFETAEKLCAELIAHLRGRIARPYPPEKAKDILAALRNKRQFALMCKVADAFIRTDDPWAEGSAPASGTDPQIHRQHAQALLDLGHVSAALEILQRLAAGHDIGTRNGNEARGLIGRAYKQIYLDANDAGPPHNRAVLNAAIEAYLAVYRNCPRENIWHGVNAVSLIQRARRDGVESAYDQTQTAGIARDILAEIAERARCKSLDAWDLATAAEAHIALGECAEAAGRLEEYVAIKTADAFEIASTTRQFESLLDPQACGDLAVPPLDILRAGLLQRDGGAFTATAESVTESLAAAAKTEGEGLERVHGDETYISQSWLSLAMERAKCVGRIWRGGDPIGTGFLVRGTDLHPDWPAQVFVTNNHVIADRFGNDSSSPPGSAKVTFEILGQTLGLARLDVGRLLWESPIAECDTTIVELETQIEPLPPCPVARRLPCNPGKDSVFVIGHPLGGELAYSFNDTRLIDINERKIHYRSPTDPGSSGSPLFDRYWELIGIHHSGSSAMPRLVGSTLDTTPARYAANEGIGWPAILAGIREQTPG